MSKMRTDEIVDAAGTGAVDFPNGVTIAGTPFTPGNDGVDGIDGTNGTNGVDGVDGVDGTNGTNGTNGADGTNGTNGTNGADGADGAPGADGADGAPGADGADGVGVPNGGAVGQVLTKINAVDGNTEWTDRASYVHLIKTGGSFIQPNIRYMLTIPIANIGLNYILPASPSNGDTIFLVDGNSNFSTTLPVVTRNGNTIQGVADDLTLNFDNANVTLVFNIATNDWRVFI